MTFQPDNNNVVPNYPKATDLHTQANGQLWGIRHEIKDCDHLALVRANCLATNTEYCDRCTHTATQATNVAQIKTKGTKGLLTVSSGRVRV
jgi:hypothetical protein